MLQPAPSSSRWRAGCRGGGSRGALGGEAAAGPGVVPWEAVESATLKAKTEGLQVGELWGVKERQQAVAQPPEGTVRRVETGEGGGLLLHWGLKWNPASLSLASSPVKWRRDHS